MPSVKTAVVAAALAAIVVVPALTSSSAGSQIHVLRAGASAPHPRLRLKANRMRPRPRAVAPGTVIASGALFTDRVFANDGHGRAGFALADDGNAQYPASSQDGGRTWHIDGPQLHVDAADGPEGVGFVGVASAKTLFAYGSSAVDVSTDGGGTWWETYMGELVMAVVPGLGRNELVAYVQQSVSNDRVNPAVTWQYISRDGGRHWRYSTEFGGLS